jgi:uncharacterized membrane protein
MSTSYHILYGQGVVSLGNVWQHITPSCQHLVGTVKAKLSQPHFYLSWTAVRTGCHATHDGLPFIFPLAVRANGHQPLVYLMLQ